MMPRRLSPWFTRFWGSGRPVLAAIVSALALVACGGGGGGGDPGGGGGLTAPVITVQPASVSVASGGSATFSVTATGGGLAYAWQRSTNGGVSFTPVAGASAATLTVGPVDASQDGHRYLVVVQNPLGIATSASAVLTVTPTASAPTFTLQPLDQTVSVPAAATFTVAASGVPAPALTWQVSTDGGSTWTAIAGATAASYTTPATTAADDGKRFRAVATNGSGSVNSTAATLRIGTAVRSRFVYASVNDTIVGFVLDPASGALTATPGSPVTVSGTRGSTLTLHPSGNWLLATGEGSTGTWVYAIDGATGRLTLVSGSPFVNGFTPGSKPVMDPAGRYLAMASGTGMAVQRFDAATGRLTATGTLLGVSAANIAFSPDSRFMFVHSFGTSLTTVNTDPLSLGPTPSPAITPSGEAFVRGDRLVALLSSRSVVTMSIAPTNGALSIVGTLPTGSTSSTTQLAATSDPQCLLVRSREASSSETMLPVRIDPATQALSSNAPVTVAGLGVERYVLMHPRAAFGWLGGLPNVLTGQLTPLALGAGCSVAAGSGGNYAAPDMSQSPLFDSSGTWMISSTSTTAGILVWRLDGTTRRPVAVTGSPFATAASPGSLVLRE